MVFLNAVYRYGRFCFYKTGFFVPVKEGKNEAQRLKTTGGTLTGNSLGMEPAGRKPGSGRQEVAGIKISD
jgi:hypothetical protein